MNRRQFLLAAAAPLSTAIAESIRPAKSLNLKITGLKMNPAINPADGNPL